MPRVSPDMTGSVFGFLVVLHRGPARMSGATWVCKCECGNVRTVRAVSLREGKTRSCGCLRRSASQERMRQRAIARKNETRYSFDEAFADAARSAAAKLASVRVRFDDEEAA